VSGTYNTDEPIRNIYKHLVGKPEKGDHLGDPAAHERVILTFVLEE
jgi:hypothetical protein